MNFQHDFKNLNSWFLRTKQKLYEWLKKSDIFGNFSINFSYQILCQNIVKEMSMIHLWNPQKSQQNTSNHARNSFTSSISSQTSQKIPRNHSKVMTKITKDLIWSINGHHIILKKVYVSIHNLLTHYNLLQDFLSKDKKKNIYKCNDMKSEIMH